MSDVQSHYDELSSSYDEKVNLYCQRRFIELIRKHTGRNDMILEVGCATGYIQDALGRNVVGVDVTESLLEKNRNKVIRADALSLPFKDGSFDSVYSVNVLEHVSDAGRMINECRRVVRSGGRLIIITPNGDMELFLDIAEKLRMKLPEGPHKFLGYDELKDMVAKNGLHMLSAGRLVLVPFSIPLVTALSRRIEKHAQRLCLFLAIVCRKP